jgi:hypothetical protein
MLIHYSLTNALRVRGATDGERLQVPRFAVRIIGIVELHFHLLRVADVFLDESGTFILSLVAA